MSSKRNLPAPQDRRSGSEPGGASAPRQRTSHHDAPTLHELSEQIDAAISSGSGVADELDRLHGDLAETGEDRQLTVLLVDDCDEVREVVRDVLLYEGFRVLEAPDGLHGLVLCAQHANEIDLAIVDIMMPGIDGRQFVQEVAGIAPQLKVLFVSGSVHDSDVRQWLSTHEFHFVAKPFMPDALVRAVRRVIETSVALHGRVA